jgi:hypothetical protein
MTDLTARALRPLAGLLVALLIVAFSPLVNSDTGWKNTLGGIVWWAIIAVVAALVVAGVHQFVLRRRGSPRDPRELG